MLRLSIIAVGGLGERHWTDACAEYQKRLGAFCKTEIIEVPERRISQNPSGTEIRKCVEAEGSTILAKIPPRSYVVALCIEGKLFTSEELASEFQRVAAEASQIVFVVGGSHGLSDSVKAAAHRRLSMSRMTFPHQMARVMLLEQAYRAFSISNGGKYHK